MAEFPTVAEQKEQGVASDDTVTVADQKAGKEVPLGTEIPKVDTLAPAGQRPDDPAEKSKVLSPEDEADLIAFRGQQEQARIEAAKIAPPPPSHYLHLEDGRVVKSAGVMTHYHDLLVLNAVPITE